MSKNKDSKLCAWRGCAAPATRLLTWGEGVQQEFCNYHADAALGWANIREHDWELNGSEAAAGKLKKGDDNGKAK